VNRKTNNGEWEKDIYEVDGERGRQKVRKEVREEERKEEGKKERKEERKEEEEREEGGTFEKWFDLKNSQTSPPLNYPGCNIAFKF